MEMLSTLAAGLGFSAETFLALARREEIPAVLVGARWYSTRDILIEGLKLRHAEAVKPKGKTRRAGAYQKKRAAEMAAAAERLARLGVKS